MAAGTRAPVALEESERDAPRGRSPGPTRARAIPRAVEAPRRLERSPRRARGREHRATPPRRGRVRCSPVSASTRRAVPALARLARRAGRRPRREARPRRRASRSLRVGVARARRRRRRARGNPRRARRRRASESRARSRVAPRSRAVRRAARCERGTGGASRAARAPAAAASSRRLRGRAPTRATRHAARERDGGDRRGDARRSRERRGLARPDGAARVHEELEPGLDDVLDEADVEPLEARVGRPVERAHVVARSVLAVASRPRSLARARENAACASAEAAALAARAGRASRAGRRKRGSRRPGSRSMRGFYPGETGEFPVQSTLAYAAAISTAAGESPARGPCAGSHEEPGVGSQDGPRRTTGANLARA